MVKSIITVFLLSKPILPKPTQKIAMWILYPFQAYQNIRHDSNVRQKQNQLRPQNNGVALFIPSLPPHSAILLAKNSGKSSRTTKHSTQLGIRFIVSGIYIPSHCFGNGARNTIKYPSHVYIKYSGSHILYIALLSDKINWPVAFDRTDTQYCFSRMLLFPV